MMEGPQGGGREAPEETAVMDWVFWDVGEVYAAAAQFCGLLVSSFMKLLPVFFLILTVVGVIGLFRRFFGDQGIF